MASIPAAPHHEIHYIGRVNWLRAAILGANDGIVSTASLVIGIAASGASREAILLSGVAALVAGAMSMAAGEFVSVSAQADVERADLAIERSAIAEHPDAEREELRDIYISRGLDPELAERVAAQLMKVDPLGAHARDELGITPAGAARPIQAAGASAASFAAGAAAPLIAALIASAAWSIAVIAGVSLLCLALLGYLGAQAGGARRWRSVARVLFWGLFAMAVTAGAGHLFGAVV